jgi:hypothetical protein
MIVIFDRFAWAEDGPIATGQLTAYLTPRSVVLEKLICQGIPAVMGPEGSLPCSKEPATESYPESVKSNSNIFFL